MGKVIPLNSGIKYDPSEEDALRNKEDVKRYRYNSKQLQVIISNLKLPPESKKKIIKKVKKEQK
jgi:hypothetical protein